MIRCVLLDLDGVVRHFDPAHRSTVERQHGIASGRLEAVGFAPELIDAVVTGRMTRAEWTTEIGQRVGSAQAAIEWLAARGSVDHEVLALADELRAEGLRTSILTNGTDTIDDEMAKLGIDRHFDPIFNSAAIGLAKPDPAVFRHVCEALALEPSEVYFSDDSPAKLAGAVEIGMWAEPYVGVTALRARLEEVRFRAHD